VRTPPEGREFAAGESKSIKKLSGKLNVLKSLMFSSFQPEAAQKGNRGSDIQEKEKHRFWFILDCGSPQKNRLILAHAGERIYHIKYIGLEAPSGIIS
jgi:hypothetical protein